MNQAPTPTVLRSVLSSPAVAAFLPAQDLLGLGEEARFNSPGKPDGNWRWRMSAQDRGRLEGQAARLRTLLRETGRLSA